jgi:hypothetical protein
VDQTLPSTSLTSTTNVIIHGMEGQGCGDDEIVGDFAGEEGEMISMPLPIVSPDFVKGGIEMLSRGSGTSTAC